MVKLRDPFNKGTTAGQLWPLGRLKAAARIEVVKPAFCGSTDRKVAMSFPAKGMRIW
jgi:hypothetical protein